MKIAILGAGFSGLAVAWQLLEQTKAQVMIDLFDPLPIGKGTSGISPGLLHTFAGKRARLAWGAAEGMQAMHEHLKIASDALGHSCLLSNGILRPAFEESQIEDFQTCAQKYSRETEWWSKETCLDKVTGLVFPDEKCGGLFIKEGLTLNAPSYLEGLWQACARLGTQHRQEAVSELESLKKYDVIICALGTATLQIKELSHLPLTPIKGQILKMKWPSHIPPLPFSIISGGYIVMDREQEFCRVGTTFEREFSSPDPDPDFAKEQILTKITPFFPSLAEAEIVDCQAGIRAATGGFRLPLVDQITDKVWVITGMGAKGLLYHAWMGKLLAQALLRKNRDLIPLQVRSQ